MAEDRNTFLILSFSRADRVSSAVPPSETTLIFRFSAPWLNGGAPYDVSYVVGSRKGYSDTTFAGLKANQTDLISTDATLVGKVNSWNSGDLALYPLTPKNGKLSISVLSRSPPEPIARDQEDRSL